MVRSDGTQEVWRDGEKIECPFANKNFDGLADEIVRTNSYVGKSNWNDALFHGIITDLRVFTEALNPTEIKYLRDSRKASIANFINLRGNRPYYTFSHNYEVEGNPVKTLDPRS